MPSKKRIITTASKMSLSESRSDAAITDAPTEARFEELEQSMKETMEQHTAKVLKALEDGFSDIKGTFSARMDKIEEQILEMKNASIKSKSASSKASGATKTVKAAKEPKESKKKEGAAGAAGEDTSDAPAKAKPRTPPLPNVFKDRIVDTGTPLGKIVRGEEKDPAIIDKYYHKDLPIVTQEDIDGNAERKKDWAKKKTPEQKGKYIGGLIFSALDAKQKELLKKKLTENATSANSNKSVPVVGGDSDSEIDGKL